MESVGGKKEGEAKKQVRHAIAYGVILAKRMEAVSVAFVDHFLSGTFPSGSCGGLGFGGLIQQLQFIQFISLRSGDDS